MTDYTIERHTTMKDGAELTIKRSATLPESDDYKISGKSDTTDALAVFFADWEKMEKEYKQALKNNETVRLFFYMSTHNTDKSLVSWVAGREVTAEEAKNWNDCGKAARLIDLFAQLEQEAEKR